MWQRKRERIERRSERFRETLSRLLEAEEKKKFFVMDALSFSLLFVFTYSKKSKARKKSIVSSSLSLSPHPKKTMENHLLRHGEAMEAELKAMGAVQLGVSKRRSNKGGGSKKDGWPSIVRSSVFDALSNASVFLPLFLSLSRACFVPAWLRPRRLSSYMRDGI